MDSPRVQLQRFEVLAEIRHDGDASIPGKCYAIQAMAVY